VSNLKQVAERAGVSTATVSNVLAGTARVSEATRARVLRAVSELDYHPDLIAQSLRKRNSRTLGMIIPDIANPFFPQIVRGAEDAAWEEGFLLLTLNTDEKAQREQLAISAMRARRVDGLLVIAGPHADSESTIQSAAQKGLPLVTLDRQLKAGAFDCVLLDNRPAVREGVTAMMRAGCRRIGYIGGPDVFLNARERLKGYIDGLTRAGIEFDSSLVLAGDYHRECGYRHALALLSLPSPPDGIFAANGMMALGIFDALMRFPLQSTQNIVIGHLDDLPFTPLPPWTVIAVSQPTYEIGYRGAQLLLSRIRGEGGPGQKEIRLSSTIQLREKPANAFQAFAGLAAVGDGATGKRSDLRVQRR
jgi:LacI family transcriptional regulator